MAVAEKRCHSACPAHSMKVHSQGESLQIEEGGEGANGATTLQQRVGIAGQPMDIELLADLCAPRHQQEQSPSPKVQGQAPSTGDLSENILSLAGGVRAQPRHASLAHRRAAHEERHTHNCRSPGLWRAG